MIGAIDNGLLTSDLDADGFAIVNIGSITPPPPHLITDADPRLSDHREPLDGSVVNNSVAIAAAIDQSKLNLDGTIPPSWLGFDSTHAAPGDLTEYVANKGIAGGYAALDATGKVPVLQLPNDAGTGTVTSVGLSMPADFSVANSPVTTSGTITVTWVNVPDGTWFGNNTGGSAIPAFHSSAITASMVPQLDASKITTGTIDVARLPAAIGVGTSHASGVVPDPGAVGNATDYLARDMTYKPVPTIGPSYQPMVSDPLLTPLSVGADVIVTIKTSVSGASLFYKIIPTMTDYAEAPSSAHVLTGQTLNAYAAKVGYTNSNIVSFVNT